MDKKIVALVLILVFVIIGCASDNINSTITLNEAMKIFDELDILKKEEYKAYLLSLQERIVKAKLSTDSNTPTQVIVENNVIEFIYDVEMIKFKYYYEEDKETAQNMIDTLDGKFLQKITRYSKNKHVQNKELIARYTGLYFMMSMVSSAKDPWVIGNSFLVSSKRALGGDPLVDAYARLEWAMYDIVNSGFGGGFAISGYERLQDIINDDTLQNRKQLQLMALIYSAWRQQAAFSPKNALIFINMALELYPEMGFLHTMKENLYVGDYAF